MATFTYSSSSDQDDLIDEVEGWADKVTATGQSIGINRESIYQYLARAMRLVLQSVPRDAVDKLASDGSGQSTTNQGSYTQVVIPEDFLIFLSLELSEWKRTVYEWVDPRSDQHRLQYNSFTAADAQNPVVSKVPAPSTANGEAFRCYPQDSGPTLSEFAYVPETAPEDVPSQLVGPMVLQATGFTLVADKEEGSQMAFDIATLLMEQIERGKTPMVQEAYEQVREAQQ